MGNLICCCWRTFCCECACFEKKDDWNILNECRPGERGAGYLYKRAKNSAMWSKRYFSINDHKMVYYLDRDRGVMKGEIVLAGATAALSTTRADTKKKFYFTISHPVCGVREVYAKTRNRRKQWVEKINEVSAILQQRVVYGKLLKQGGLSKNVWQERWCICTGVSIDYFDSPTENQSKGNLVITGATITPTKIKDRFCFEVVARAGSGKKGGKKYVFCAEKEVERDKWVELLRRFAAQNPASFAAPTWPGEPTNPLQPMESRDEDEEGGAGGSGARGSEGVGGGEGRGMEREESRDRESIMYASSEQAGYLLKKSPALMKGWQRRFFRTCDNGDIQYFKTEEDSTSNDKAEKGVIKLSEILKENGVVLNEKTLEFTIHTLGKSVQLKAGTLDEATDWCRNILAWVETTK